MEKRFKNGLVLGKFMPPHKGHLFLIDSAIEQCVTTHVMVCSDETQPIPGYLRFQWLKTIYKGQPNVKIIWCRDKNPQYPSECESLDVFYKKYWVKSVYDNIKELDVVFTSEEYGDEFASYLGIEHVSIDQPRKTYQVSGTDIRNDALNNWEFIPDVVRPYFTKKVVIVGPESTGKSVLTKKLARHYGTEYVEEYGREYTNIHGTTNLISDDFTNIAKGHFKNVNDKLLHGNKVLFVDTEAIVTRIFGEMYLEKDFDPLGVDNIVICQHYDLYLLLDVDVPWIDDGTRDFPQRRKEHFDTLKRELEARNISYVVITGDYDERFQKAIKEVDKLGYLYSKSLEYEMVN
jgi:HTH-type transcriptional regulator, transcriptional repressor of NAD biosynthesis genes